MKSQHPLSADAVELYDVDVLEEGLAPSFDMGIMCAPAPGPGPTEPSPPAPPDTTK